MLSNEGGLYFVGGGQFILHPFSHFEMQDFKNSESFCLQVERLQVDIVFNTEFNFSFSRSSFFSPLSGH